MVPERRLPVKTGFLLPMMICALGEPDFLLLAVFRYIDNLAFGLIDVIMLSLSACNAMSYSSDILLILFISASA